MLKCFNIMKIMQLHLYLLIWCQAAKTLTDRLTDLGLYYCVTTDPPPKYSNGTRLHITDPTLNLESKNHTVVKYIEKDQSHWLIILISAVFNGVLIIVIIGLVKVFVLGSKRTRDNLKRSQDPHLQQPQVLHLEQPQNSSQVQQQTTNTVEEPLDLIRLSLDERIYLKMRNDRETSLCCGGSSYITSKVSVQPSQ
ncbi:hypothetical protein ROHU_014967 [Labeo rohita]|uniref:Uncharacterized protein n=1 Tax=Labeo rohita TaxID=84645 RepID=A0A498NS49_LABRO|nr:hypothetical protein ROHU_014967 [Labeo rohita]